jgi:hypothetical protein
MMQIDGSFMHYCAARISVFVVPLIVTTFVGVEPIHFSQYRSQDSSSSNVDVVATMDAAGSPPDRPCISLALPLHTHTTRLRCDDERRSGGARHLYAVRPHAGTAHRNASSRQRSGWISLDCDPRPPGTMLVARCGS